MKLENVTFSYDKSRVILDNVSFSTVQGEHIGIVGANGAGKTTMLKLMVGLLMVQGGRISVGDITVARDTLPQIRKHIGYVFQDSDSQLFMPTVVEDVMFGPRNYGYSEEEAERMAEDAMKLTGSEHLKNRQIHKLSGGEKKLTAIASVLALKPEVIIMDEPTNSLDPGNRRRLINVLNELKCTELIATHDLDMVWDICGRVILLSEGRVAASGPTRDILTDKELLEANGLELPLSAKLYKSLNCKCPEGGI
ncbi:MAG: ABC transporter ATP-binding protein [Clostridiales bacterium]|nr:ABC transporter ATP-binding protein [Clostridiales bacterium]